MKCFTADMLGFLPKSVKIWLSGGLLSTCHQIQAFQRFLLKFPNFLRSEVSSRSATREATRTFTL